MLLGGFSPFVKQSRKTEHSDKSHLQATARAATRTLVLVSGCYLFSNMLNVIITVFEHVNREYITSFDVLVIHFHLSTHFPLVLSEPGANMMGFTLQAVPGVHRPRLDPDGARLLLPPAHLHGVPGERSWLFNGTNYDLKLFYNC